MSYINDALKKAQQDRDCRYERFGRLISSGPARPGNPRKRRLTRVVVATVSILIPAGLLLAVYVLWQPFPVTKKEQPPLAAGSPAAVHVLPEQTAEDAGSVNEVLARPLPGNAPLRGDVVPTDRAADRKPAPGEAEARYKEALAAQRRGDLPEAEVLYEKVLALDSRDVRALNNLGIVCMGLKKRERAIALLIKAIVMKRDYVDPYYNLACLYARTNEIDESLWYLQVAMTINGEVRNWAEKDADMKNVVDSPAFKRVMEGQKN